MPPKFSLQTVLDVRHSKVEALEIELGLMMQEKLQKENYLHTLYLAQDKLYEALHQSMSGMLDLIQVNLLRANINQVGSQLQATNQQIQDLENRVTIKREDLITAKKEEESLKLLKTREYERFLEEEKEKEKRFMDDVYISQGFRQRRSEMHP
jgi:flagellar export protein FliJ